MCEPVSIAAGTMAVMGVAGGVMGAKGQAKQAAMEEDQRRKQQREIVRQTMAEDNMQQLQTVDKFEEARKQLTQVNIDTLRNLGTVRAAIGESGLSGNSMDRLERLTEAEGSAQAMDIKDNYERDYQAIFANRVSGVETAKGQLRGFAKMQKRSALADALNIVSGGIGGAAQGASMGSAYKNRNAGGKK